jgi:NAD(P)-dependent dehydrogenase (short-subunit alcohol dehydrogenase family)
MNLGINKKVALVTGGAQGIGSSISRHLLEEGAVVIVTSRSDSALQKFCSDNAQYHGRLHAVKCELTDDDGPDLLLSQIASLGLDIDILVNNAGHTMNVTDPWCSIEDWRKVFRLNFEVPIKLINIIVPSMKVRGWGRVVNITSCAGLENSGPVTFSTVKAALTAYTRSMGRVLAIEAPKIVMTAVFPGVVITKGGHWEAVLANNPSHAQKYLDERCPLGRFGEIDEIGPIVAVYCSELASFCHGSIIPVDAGQSKHFMSFNYME